jgi:hypothetical protein
MRGRSVIEILVLAFTFVVAFSILAIGATVAIVEIRDPEADTSSVVQALLSLISGIMGALLGLIAGRTSASSQLEHRPGDDEP